MEIKINIPQNEFVTPKEIRPHLVESICKYLIAMMERGVCAEGCTSKTITPNTPLFFYSYGDGIRYEIKCYTEEPSRTTRIRGVEMQAVFSALQDAGYYIYGFNCNGEHEYVFSKKPSYRDFKATRIEFTTFID